jgi:thiamine-phosphate pyrophosphorylase
LLPGLARFQKLSLSHSATGPDMTPFTMPPRGLYLLTPEDADAGRLRARVEPLLATGGVALLQLRCKEGGAGRRRAHALALREASASAGVPLLVNDDWRLAAELGLGAHLGGEDGSLAEARAALAPGAILGASCYDELERARRAAGEGADYLAFGAFFPSGTKPLARRAAPALLLRAATLGKPRVAIGGIRADNGGTLLAAGADFLAVLGAVFEAPDPPAAVREFQTLFDSFPTT